jgi:hypothetical protein
VPRPHFLPFHARSERWSVLVCHRRQGKTVACINDLISKGVYSRKPRPRYAYIAPLRNQAKKIAWEYLKEYAGPIIRKKSEVDLSVIIEPSGSEISLYGADNPDAFRGQYFDGVILDEYADMSPTIFSTIIVPTLSDRKGWLVFIGTPKGKNHFKEKWDEAGEKAGWFRMMCKASESGIIDEEELAIARSNMSEDEYAQEYECSFDAAVKGTYYASLIQELEQSGQIFNINAEYDSEFPVNVYSDLGYTDSTALWFAQARPDGHALIDYEEHHCEPLLFYFDLLRNKGYNYERIWLPHDARAKTLQTGRSTIEQFIYNDFPVDIVPSISVQHGIDAARMLLRNCWFNPRTKLGVEALRNYQRSYDDIRKVFSDNPLHNWASHGSDAFRMFAVAARKRIMPVNEESRGWTKPIICLDNLWDTAPIRDSRRY